MLKPYERHKREVDKLLRNIEDDVIREIVEDILTNYLCDIVYESTVTTNELHYRTLQPHHNLTRLVLSVTDEDTIVQIFSATGQTGVTIDSTDYHPYNLLPYNRCTLVWNNAKVIMIDTNADYNEIKNDL